MKFKAGDELVCTNSASFAYTKGGFYDVYVNEKGFKCLLGNDGLEDLLSMVVSTFRKKEEEDLEVVQ